jgi:hypothetical protein
MMSDESVLCRLELDSFGTPPRCCKLEARQHAEGFSVWLWDEHLHPNGKEVAVSERAYDARRFAQIVIDAGIADTLEDWVRVPRNAWQAVRVTGERCLKAALLSLASTTGNMHSDFFMTQSDASFKFLHELVETFNDER